MKAEDIAPDVITAAITNDLDFNSYPSLNVAAEITAMKHASTAFFAISDGKSVKDEHVQDNLSKAFESLVDVDMPDTPEAIGSFKIGLLIGFLMGFLSEDLQQMVKGAVEMAKKLAEDENPETPKNPN